MKKLMICSAALMAAVAALAVDVPSANEIGVTVVSVAKTGLTTVAVPYVGVGGGAIQVTDLVDKRSLVDKDAVRVWTGSDYTVFKYSEGVFGAELSDAQVQTTLPVATGFVFAPASGSADGKTVRLVGQVPTGSLKTAIAAGKQTICSNPSTSELNLSSVSFTSETRVKIPGVGDFLWKQNEGTWGWYELTTTTKQVKIAGKVRNVTASATVAVTDTSRLAIAPGATFWCSAAAAETIQWN